MALRLPLVGVSLISLGLAACGGGGGGGSVNSTPPPAPIGQVSLPNPMPGPTTKPTGEDFNTTEYRNSSAAMGSNAIGAWEQGATGKDITIGFVDTGLVPTLSDFAGRIDPASRDVNGTRPMDDVWGHGTALAGIAAAARDNSGMEGIAFEATIFMAKADEGCPESCRFPTVAIASGIDAARAAGAKVINLSIGANDATGDVLAAARRAIDAGIVIVVGAGNSGSSPSGFARELASLAPNQVIIVGGLGVSNVDGSINYDVPSIYTTAAGSAQSYFLAAPGWLNAATYFRGGGIDKLSGTSFAAPVVSGAIALLADAFPMLTPQQMVLLLYMTADDLGVAGIDSVFGRGRLNIGRAFQPVGTARLASTMAAVPASIGSLPTAAGDAARRGSLRATIIDDFKRPFDMNLAATFVEVADLGPLARSLVGGHLSNSSTALGPVSLAFTLDESVQLGGTLRALQLSAQQERSTRLLAATAIMKLTNSLSVAVGLGTFASSLDRSLSQRPVPDFLLAEDAAARPGFNARRPTSLIVQHQRGGWRLSVSAERGSIAAIEPREREADYFLLGLHVGRQFYDGNFRFGISRLLEPQTMLGGRLDDIFGQHGAQTWFVDASANHSFGHGWSMGTSIRRGWTALPSGRFVTSAYSADVTRFGAFSSNDAVTFRVAQPLRVERGSIGAFLPESWDYKTETFTEASRQLHLTPSGRERFFELGYLRNLPTGSLGLHLYHRTDPGHIDNSRNDTGGALRANFRL
jgi:hypothetical protein